MSEKRESVRVESIYLDIGNGGINIWVEDTELGAQVVMTSSYLGASGQEFRFYTSPESLAEISDMFRVASVHEFSKTYCNAATGSFCSKKTMERWKKEKEEEFRRSLPSALLNYATPGDDSYVDIDIEAGGQVVGIIKNAKRGSLDEDGVRKILDQKNGSLRLQNQIFAWKEDIIETKFIPDKSFSLTLKPPTERVATMKVDENDGFGTRSPICIVIRVDGVAKLVVKCQKGMSKETLMSLARESRSLRPYRDLFISREEFVQDESLNFITSDQ